MIGGPPCCDGGRAKAKATKAKADRLEARLTTIESRLEALERSRLRVGTPMASEVYMTPEGTVTSDPVKAAELWALKATELKERLDGAAEKCKRATRSYRNLLEAIRNETNELDPEAIVERTIDDFEELAQGIVAGQPKGGTLEALGQLCADDERKSGAPIAGRPDGPLKGDADAMLELRRMGQWDEDEVDTILAEHSRAPVQGDLGPDGTPAGTISWGEHVLAWEAYARKYGKDQSAECIAERSGFSYEELVMFLGHEPKTWRPVRAEDSD